MRIRFYKGKQNWLMEKAIVKAGSERKLGNLLGIPHQKVNNYRRELRNLSDERLDLVLNFLQLNKKKIEKYIKEELDENWGRHKGGINLIKKHKLNGTYDDYLIYLKKRGKKVFSKWHATMKKDNPEKYYNMQFEKFRKSIRQAGLHKYKTKNGEIVRNELEKDIANILYLVGLKYEYEPYMEVNGSRYFPDFKVGGLIIECTAWRGYWKVAKLKKKIKDFEKEGFNIRVIVPPKIKKFYKAIESKIIEYTDEATVAQSLQKLSV